MARILIIGSGGREHALAWSLAGEARHEIYCAPGNPGTARLGTNVSLDNGDHQALIEFARSERIDLTIVGPEAPLAAGIVDDFQGSNQKIFGPGRAAAQLEASKLFARQFMHEYRIPQPAYMPCSNREEVWAAVEQLGLPVVLKADGLAAGKGVIVCHSESEVEAALARFFDDRSFGDAGRSLSVEECLVGTEMSVFALCDGKNFNIIGTAQDYKRAYDGDQGPNTGGMGSIAPSRLASADLLEEISATIIQPTLDGMRQRGSPYVGVLYAGLMIIDNEPFVIEFNVRMGDPETQVVLPLLGSPLYDLIDAALEGHVPVDNRVKQGAAISVVLAAKGYPGQYKKGLPITGLGNLDDDVILFHAGTREENGQLLSSGGRVLNVVATGDNLNDAARQVYENCARIDFPGGFHRKDIGG
ncbi:MAG: phosphoribosylamine--glycine ligase [Candidatus Marinimicrobia bacterium]|nr:phosphoribosylamine--glycine ligase [Candidatus Neomarinimicrobiota bacterium]